MTVTKGVAVVSDINNKKIRSVIRKRNQITLGKELMEQMGISEGDTLEFRVHNGMLLGIPLETKPKSDQSWYWSDSWQAAENSVDEWLDQGGLDQSPKYTAEQFLEEMKYQIQTSFPSHK